MGERMQMVLARSQRFNVIFDLLKYCIYPKNLTTTRERTCHAKGSQEKCRRNRKKHPRKEKGLYRSLLFLQIHFATAEIKNHIIYKSIPARSLTFGSILSLSETSPLDFDASP